MVEINGKRLCENCFEELTPNAVFCSHCGYNPAVGTGDPSVIVPSTMMLGRCMVGKFMGNDGSGAKYLAYDVSAGRKGVLKETNPGAYEFFPDNNAANPPMGQALNMPSAGYVQQAQPMQPAQGMPSAGYYQPAPGQPMPGQPMYNMQQAMPAPKKPVNKKLIAIVSSILGVALVAGIVVGVSTSVAKERAQEAALQSQAEEAGRKRSVESTCSSIRTIAVTYASQVLAATGNIVTDATTKYNVNKELERTSDPDEMYSFDMYVKDQISELNGSGSTYAVEFENGRVVKVTYSAYGYTAEWNSTDGQKPAQ